MSDTNQLRRIRASRAKPRIIKVVTKLPSKYNKIIQEMERQRTKKLIASSIAKEDNREAGSSGMTNPLESTFEEMEPDPLQINKYIDENINDEEISLTPPSYSPISMKHSSPETEEILSRILPSRICDVEIDEHTLITREKANAKRKRADINFHRPNPSILEQIETFEKEMDEWMDNMGERQYSPLDQQLLRDPNITITATQENNSATTTTANKNNDSALDSAENTPSPESLGGSMKPTSVARTQHWEKQRMEERASSHKNTRVASAAHLEEVIQEKETAGDADKPQTAQETIQIPARATAQGDQRDSIERNLARILGEEQ